MSQLIPQGVGLGLRFPHFDHILSGNHQTPWFEVIADDFLNQGPHHNKLLELRANSPIVFHSVGLNLGGIDPFNREYLDTFKEIYAKFEPAWISDHLCWSAHNGAYHHDLLPIPRTTEALQNVCERIHFLQDEFKREICIENVTSYIEFKNEDFTETEFIKKILNSTGCKLLLDISNVAINFENRGVDSKSFISELPLDQVTQVHLAGGSWDEDVLIDSHSEPVPESHIRLLKFAYENGLSAPTLIERDANIPSFEELEAERQLVSRRLSEVL